MTIFRNLKSEFSVFIIFFLTYAFFFQGSDHNTAARMDSIRAVVEDGTFVIDRFIYNSADVIQLNDHFYSSKAPGTFFLGAVPFVGAKTFLSVFVKDENLKYQWVNYFTTVFAISLGAALFCVVLFWFLQQLAFSKWTALTVTIAFGLGTLFFPFSTLFFSHSPAAVFLFTSFILLWTAKTTTAFIVPLKQPALWAGIAGALSVSMEYPAALFFLCLQFYAFATFFQKDKKAWLYFILGSAVGVVPLLVHNAAAFHNIFYLPYEAYAKPNGDTTFAAHAKGFLGIQNAFTNPHFLSVLWKITFHPQRGVFFNCPVLLSAIPGIYFMWKNLKHLRAELAVSLAIVFCAVYVNANYGDSIVYWGGGYSFGPRHLLAAVPFLLVPMACVVEHKYWKYLFAVTLVPSVIICWAATAVEPRIPYDFQNPVTQFLMPKFLNGVYAINDAGIFSNVRLTENSVAFNWGKLMHLPGVAQMLPLVLAWLIFLFCFFRKQKTEKIV